jgi:hypothetical protein
MLSRICLGRGVMDQAGLEITVSQCCSGDRPEQGELRDHAPEPAS